VHAHGRVSHEALRELLASSDVLVTPSTTAESFGLTVLEGMAAGLPVVASAIPAHRDLLPESCGRLVPPGRPQALAAAIEDVLSSPDARAAMGHAGRRAAAAYDWAAVGPRIIEVYRQELATCVAA
jgi:phosphatidylinositol alpha-mannosyltransferase